MIEWIILKLSCYKFGHSYAFEDYTLGGHWIRCVRTVGHRVCRHLEEYLPGVHEVENYDWYAVYEKQRPIDK